MAFRFETANERWTHYRESVAEHPFHSPSEYNYSDSEYEALMGHGRARNPRGPINTIEMEQNDTAPGRRVDSPTTINMRKHIPMAQQLFDQGFNRDQIKRELVGAGLLPEEAAAVAQRFYLDNPYTKFEGEGKEQERRQRRETANSKQSITEHNQFNPNSLGYDKPLRAKSPMKVDQTNVQDYTWAKKEGDYLTETFSTLIPWLVNSGRFDVLDEIRIDLETLLHKYGFKYSELR